MISYRPEPFTDFHETIHAKQFDDALQRAAGELEKEYPLVIGGKRIMTGERIDSLNPSQKHEIIGKVSKADRELAEQAMQAAMQAFGTWSRVPAEQRARYLFKAAAILRRRKHDLSAWLLLEAGKSRAEADADTAEAIDFMEYYGRQMIELAQRGQQTLVPLSGEDNQLDYIPLGVGVVIPPWNFPLAILVGMTTASIVSGNTVVLKPASATPVIAYQFFRILEEAGIPAGVVNYLPGSGSDIGDFLVEHPLTRFVAFTGSRDVGLRINQLAAKPDTGQIWLKRVIAEMGGKDSIIVDKDADLESAALNIVNSAFGFSGQKCSACSRVIVHQDVYDEVLKRCVEITQNLKVGDVRDVSNYTGPIIDEQAFKKIMDYIEIGKSEGTLAVGGGTAEGNGFYIQPTIFAGVTPEARIMQEEIFGPVVAFTKVRSFDHAIEVANNTLYGLTGSVFTRSRAHIEQAKREFHVGNLYFNRRCTGALVGVHPFGGFNLSGTDSKAGGPDYLMLFTQAKLTSEVL